MRYVVLSLCLITIIGAILLAWTFVFSLQPALAEEFTSPSFHKTTTFKHITSPTLEDIPLVKNLVLWIFPYQPDLPLHFQTIVIGLVVIVFITLILLIIRLSYKSNKTRSALEQKNIRLERQVHKRNVILQRLKQRLDMGVQERINAEALLREHQEKYLFLADNI